MPAPTVEWVHNSGSIDVSIFIHENFLGRRLHEFKLSRSQNHDFDSNTIMERSPSGIATVVARLIIKPHHVKPGTSRTFTCVGRSGVKVVKATSKLIELGTKGFFTNKLFLFSTATVHFSHDAKHPHSAASNILSSIVGSETVKIHQFYENLFDNIGSTIMLPCKTTDPKAEVYWINESGKVISGQEPRYFQTGHWHIVTVL